MKILSAFFFVVAIAACDRNNDRSTMPSNSGGYDQTARSPGSESVEPITDPTYGPGSGTSQSPQDSSETPRNPDPSSTTTGEDSDTVPTPPPSPQDPTNPGPGPQRPGDGPQPAPGQPPGPINPSAPR